MSPEKRGDDDRVAPDLGGEAPCFAHLFPDRGDLVERQDVERLVRDFYRQVAMDDVLGPVFADAHVDWSVHLPKLTDFWMWQLFGEQDYEGNPLRAHEPAHARSSFTSQHYERWLELFDATVDERFSGPNADFAKGRARRLARAMKRLLEGGPDGPDIDAPTPGLRIGMRAPGTSRG